MAYAFPVVAVSTSNISVTAAPASIDGVALVAGNRVALAGQTTQSQNGVWMFNGTGLPMTRPGGASGDQYATGNILDNATLIPVTKGTKFAGTVWGVDPAKVITVGGAAGGTAHTLTRVSLPPVQAKAATTGNINLASTFTSIDNVNLTGDGGPTSDIVLVKAQTTVSQNGLYWANTGGAMKRADGGDLTATAFEPLHSERAIRVSDGAVNGHTQFTMTTRTPFTVGTSALRFGTANPTFVQVRAASTGNVTLPTPATTIIDGVQLVAGDLTLLKDNTTAAEHGVYLLNDAGNLERFGDPIGPETTVRVSEGTPSIN